MPKGADLMVVENEEFVQVIAEQLSVIAAARDLRLAVGLSDCGHCVVRVLGEVSAETLKELRAHVAAFIHGYSARALADGNLEEPLLVACREAVLSLAKIELRALQESGEHPELEGLDVEMEMNPPGCDPLVN